jgi:hypothetical protein
MSVCSGMSSRGIFSSGMAMKYPKMARRIACNREKHIAYEQTA